MRRRLSQTIVANKKVNQQKLVRAQKIISELQKELPKFIKKGCGPFLAAIYDQKGKLIAKAANDVVLGMCSNNHAEMNVIKAAEKIFKTYDLSQYNLALYVTAEPCTMCLGAIMWSGIKEVYYGGSSQVVENITGFDEGFKPDWFTEFKKRGITVCGHIEAEFGEKILKDYVAKSGIIYKPKRSKR